LSFSIKLWETIPAVDYVFVVFEGAIRRITSRKLHHQNPGRSCYYQERPAVIGDQKFRLEEDRQQG
jgi:hypothetical protein